MLPPLVPQSLHELLVLLLLHLELPLPLDADGQHAVVHHPVPLPAGVLVPQLSQRHALQEGARLRSGAGSGLFYQLRAVRQDLDLAVGVRGLLDREDGLVPPGLRLLVLVRGRGLCRVGCLGVAGRGMRLRQGWRAEGQELARHGVDLHGNSGFGAFRMREFDLVGAFVGVVQRVGGPLEGEAGHGLL